jgi:hypothetical protein
MKVWGRSAPCTKRKQEPGDDHCARSSTRVTIAQEQRDGSTAGLVPEGRRKEHAVALGLEDEGGFASSAEEHGFEGHPALHIPTNHGRRGTRNGRVSHSATVRATTYAIASHRRRPPGMDRLSWQLTFSSHRLSLEPFLLRHFAGRAGLERRSWAGAHRPANGGIGCKGAHDSESGRGWDVWTVGSMLRSPYLPKQCSQYHQLRAVDARGCIEGKGVAISSCRSRMWGY